MHNNVFIQPLEETLPALIRQYSKIAVLVDENTKKYCYPLLQPLLPTHSLIEIPSGEEHKHIQTCLHIWEVLTEEEFDRKSLLINLGGGVIGDMGGFCAATYKRGISFIQIPTTLLAQVDASVGGKLGIDFLGLKNHIGVFQEPKSVLIDASFLKTLTRRELRSGFAEVIKHCLIADHIAWENLIQREIDQQNWQEIITHSVKIKNEVVEADPKENGLRKILNFGHTVGHAVETFFINKDVKKRLLHGEAIAVGMICESWLAFKKGFISMSDLKTIESYLLHTFGKVIIEEKDFDDIKSNTLQDKKNEKGLIMCSLLEKIGQANYDIITGQEEIRESLAYYQSLA